MVRLRWLGFAGSVLLAIAAYLGGALPTPQRSGGTPLTVWQGDHGPLVITCWLAGTLLLTGAWWALRDGVPTARWATLTGSLWLLPLLLAPPLGSRDVYAYSCQGEVFAGGLDPYHQGVGALPCEWLEYVTPMWRDTPAPYGPLFVVLAGVVAAVTGSLWWSIIAFRVVAVAGLALTAGCLPVLARRAGVPAGRALWLGLAGPVVGVHLVSGAHNDALMVGLVLAGLAVGCRRPRLVIAAGVLLGLAGAIKVTAVVVLPFAALLALPTPFRWGAFARTAALLVGAAAGTLVLVTLAAGLDFGWVSALARSGDSVAWTSPPTAVGQTLEYLGRPLGVDLDLIPVTRALGVALLAVVLVVIWWRAHRAAPAAVLHHAGLALAATVALAPVFHPWYATWPLAVLAATATTERRIRVLVAVGVIVAFLVLPDGTPLARFTKLPGAPLMTIAVVVVSVLLLRRARSGPEVSRRGSPADSRAPAG